MKAICIRETDEVGPDRSEGGRIKCNQRPAVSSPGDIGSLLLPLLKGRRNEGYLCPCLAQLRVFSHLSRLTAVTKCCWLDPSEAEKIFPKAPPLPALSDLHKSPLERLGFFPFYRRENDRGLGDVLWRHRASEAQGRDLSPDLTHLNFRLFPLSLPKDPQI